MSQFYKFYQLPWCSRWLVIETFCLLGITRFLSFWLPFRFLTPHLGNVQQESRTSATPAQQLIIDQVGRVVRRVSHHTPWTSNCMAQAMTAKWMLQRRSISSTLYIGVHKVNEQVAAHAWLRAGASVITGGTHLEQYRQLVCFGE